MKILYSSFFSALLTFLSFSVTSQIPSLTLTGVMDFTIPSSMATISGGAQGKAIEVAAIKDISDLSMYGLGVANNGGGTDGQEYTFPAISVLAGEHILVARDTAAIHAYFGSCFDNFDHVLVANSDISQNGDDAIELFKNTNNIETFGDVNVDGTGQPWEYLDSWAWKDTLIPGSVSSSNLFTSGPNTTWTHVLTAAQISDGASSQAAQTLTINVTSLPAGGANLRVAKSTANGNNFNGPSQALSLGLNTFNVTAVSFDRYVKFQLSSGAVEFDHLVLNGNRIHYGNWGYGTPNCSDGSTSTQSSNCRYPICPSILIQNVNITLKVNTANITVGPNGMYAGGGFLGGSDALQLTDADGDGTWEGVATLPLSAAGGPNHYAFFNSPNGSSDWGTKEDLSGLPCGDPSNYNDRLLPVIANDTTIQHCYGNCASDGTCNPPPTPTCHYTIDMQDSWGDGWNGASIDVSVNGTVVANATIATGSSGVATISTLSGDVVDFSFNSGSYDNEVTFQITDPAGSQIGSYGPSPATGSFLTHTSNSICNVHFAVNTQLITVGPNGLYAGGGVLGDAMAVPLSDNDMDGTWEGFATMPTAGGHYVFLNSPNNGGDWGAKEDLSGLPCADPNNWNDRLQPAFTGNLFLQHCFGSCETDGSCPAAPGCNYTINMQDSWGDGWNGASVDVAVNGTTVANWGLASGSVGMDTLETLSGDVVDFTFNSGSYDNEVTFQITDPTGATLGSYGPSPAPGLFLTHTSNSVCLPTTVNVTFQVDMGLVTSAFTTPEVNGSWNNWAGGTNPMTDADGDGVWEVTIPLLSGNYEYKFAADNWTIQEMNDPNAPCTNGDPIYTNRVLAVGTSDATTPLVCWGSCSPCAYPPQAPSGLTCATGNPGALFTDDIDPTTGWSGDLGTGSTGGSWNVRSGATGSSGTGPSGAHSGADYLYFEASSGGDTATAVTPMIDLSSGSSDAELTFWMHAYGSGIGTLRVGASTSATGPFTELYAWSGEYQTASADPWVQVGVNMASYLGQMVYVSFTYERGTTGVSYEGDMAIDLIQVNSCLSCVAPSGLTASNVTATSADLSWTAGGTETEWFLILNGAGTTQTSTTANVTGLNPNTAYTAQVHAVCAPGDTSTASIPISFNTPCVNAVAPYTEDFSAGSLPGCWAQSATTGSGWVFSGTPGYDAGANGRAAGTYAWIDFSGTDAGTVMEVIGVDVSALTTPELAFDFFSYDGSNGSTPANVLHVEAHNGSSWVTIDSLQDNTVAGWNQQLYDLTGYDNAGVVSLRFRGESGGSSGDFYNDLLVDDIIVRETPSCYDPSGVVAVSVGADTASLSWSADPSVTAWNYVVGTAGFDPLTGTPVAVTTTTVTLSGLTGSTTYDFYVQSDCGASGVSTWVGPYSFTTIASGGTCGYFTADLVDSYGDGWNGNGLVLSINGVVTDTLTVATGTNASYVIPVDIGDVLDFAYVIDVYATGAANTWVGENSYTILDANNLPVGSGAYDPATSTVNSVLGLTACPSCSQPSALTASNISTNSADLAWTAGGTETQWNIQYGTAGFAPGTGTIVNVSANPYTLTGLTAATAYDYWVQAVCGSDSSAYAGPFTFGTSCNVSVAPTNENFDAGFSVCWSQDANDDFDWTLDANGTPSGGTGPSDDFTGGGNYMYTEASLPRAHGDVATMYSEVIDISGLSNPELRFLNHMYGSATGTLSVDLWDASTGTNLATVFTHSGDRGNQWNEELIMLSTTATTIQFSITAVLDTNTGGQAWPGDMAIDEFGVREAAANDLALVAAAVASGCDLTNAEPIELWVVNQGLVAETGFDLSYAVNGGTPVVENITSTVNPGDTLKYVFTATADMSADGDYDLDFACVLVTDNDLADNALMLSAENYYTPMAPMTDGDTICNGDTAMVYSDADYTYWYDAATGGNLVGEGEVLDVSPTATTSYYAEAAAVEGYFEDFDSYNDGDFIAVMDPDNWVVWPGGTPGGLYDAPVSSAQASSGTNSLWLNNGLVHDPVLEFGEAFSTGKFYYAMDMYIVTSAYFNFQEDVNIGTAWNMSVFFTAGVIDIQVDGASVLTGAYSTTPTGGPVWFNIEFECDYSTGTWEVFVNGNSQGTFVNPDPVASCNLYANTGDDYYIDNVEWAALKDDACRSASRTEAVVTVEDCSNISELSFKDLNIYPNPNNGQFTITNSQEMTEVIITDLQGKVIYNNNNINLNKVNVELNELERGMYMINIKTVDGMITKTITVQ